MIPDLVVQGPECETNQRRRSAHPLRDALSTRDRFLDLKPEPSPVVVAKYFVRRQVEFENVARFAPAGHRKHLQQQVRKDCKKEYDKHGEISDYEHRRDHAKGQHVLPFFADRRGYPFLERVLHNQILKATGRLT